MPIKQKINFLVVEDMVSDSFLLQRQLKKACEDPEIRFADSQLSLINALKSYVPDFVLCDFNLNGFDAFDVIEIIKDYNAIIPVIVITGQLKVEESADSLIEKGASGFFLKDPMDQLHEKLEPLFVRLLEEKKDALLKISKQRVETDSYHKNSDYFRQHGAKGEKKPGIINYFKRLFSR